MTPTAQGTFDVELMPGPSELGGALRRVELQKRFHGDLVGTADGVMLSGGDPASGSAGYVAMEIVQGRLGDRQGRFALQQFGLMHGGSQSLHYAIVPGTGDGDLSGITGTLQLRIDQDGTHHYELEYEL